MVSITPTSKTFPSNKDEMKFSKNSPIKTAGIIEINIFKEKSKLSPFLKRNISEKINQMSFLKTKIVLKAVAA